MNKKLKIVSVKQMRELDRRAIRDFEIPSLILMENAGRSVADSALRMLRNRKKEKRIVIVCGKGNNGGDGLAAARHLINWGISVAVFITAGSEEALKGDAEINLKILKNAKANIQFLTDEASGLAAVATAFRDADLIIDALFGTGLSKNLEMPYISIVKAINESGKLVLSVDIPSGLNGDTGKVMGIAVKADRTVTLARFKSGLLRGKGPRHAGIVELGYISLPGIR